MRRSTVLSGIFGLALLALLTGCGDKETKPADTVPSPYLPQSSIQNVLHNLVDSYVGRDLQEYRKLFSSDFVYRFSSADVVNPSNPTPPSWGLSEEVRAADSLFVDPKAERIQLEMGIDDAVPVDSAGTGIWKVVLAHVRLTVDHQTPDGTPLIYLAENCVETFSLRSYPQELASDGKPLWRIVGWSDLWSGGANGIASEGLSWGRIKYLFSR